VKTTVIGCGSWGSRVARRLVELGERVTLVDADDTRVRVLAGELGCAWSSDPYGFLGVTGTQASSVEGGRVVIATPPGVRVRMVRAVLGGYGVMPVSIRVEKPLASTLEEAREIVALCDEAGVELVTGFTLLHHPLYEAVFEYLQGASVLGVSAIRIGKRRPAHVVSPLADLGIHAASIAAHLGADPASVLITAAYVDGCDVRRTELATSRGSVVVDEVAGTAETPEGALRPREDARDALTLDLEAWIQGVHRGGPATALAAQEIIEAHHVVAVAA